MTKTTGAAGGREAAWDHSSHPDFYEYYAAESQSESTVRRFQGIQATVLRVAAQTGMKTQLDVADIGTLLPSVISGAAVVSIVLSLPTTGPMLLRALQTQDMYLAGSFLMLLALLTVVGVLLSDIALAVLDPRIRFEGGQTR